MCNSSESAVPSCFASLTASECELVAGGQSNGLSGYLARTAEKQARSFTELVQSGVKPNNIICADARGEKCYKGI